MVNVRFPKQLSEEEEILQKKFIILKKKKKQLQAMRAPPKPEPEPPANTPVKRSASEVSEEAKEQLKKLVQSGAIKIKDKKEKQGFKRLKKSKDPEKVNASLSFQPFSKDNEEEEREAASKYNPKSLYDSFVPSRNRDPAERRDRERDRERELPKSGHTIYIHGHGITDEILQKAFGNIGKIINVTMEDAKNCGFVTFEKTSDADKAIAEMNGTVISGAHLRVTMARRQPNIEQFAKPAPTAGSSGGTSQWGNLAANHSQKGSHKDKRDLVTYDNEDIF
ncbi:unnamed protein product [Owenia fusiformis]|uniref:Negative elongation factor E n=1 Tax=Owenia fusiformis TaxID=6347 RepID=A0A8J1UIJ3_OWEFU|nr:unnamed protein product [Owenia fusiformis]